MAPRRHALVLLVVLALASVLGACTMRTVGGDEVRELFAGSRVTGHQVRDNYHFKRFFDADGTFRQSRSPESAARTGQWKLDGKKLCIRWDGADANAAFECFRIRTDDEGHYEKVRKYDDEGTKYEPIVNYSSFDDASGADKRSHAKGLAWVWPRLVSEEGFVWTAMVLVGLFIIWLRYGAAIRAWLHRVIQSRRGPVIEAGGIRVAQAKLATVEEGTLEALVRAVAAEGQSASLLACFDAFYTRYRSKGFARLWRLVEHLDDDALMALFARFPVAVWSTPPDSARASLFFGRRALKYAKRAVGQAEFDTARKQALLLLEVLRESDPEGPAADLYREAEAARFTGPDDA